MLAEVGSHPSLLIQSQTLPLCEASPQYACAGDCCSLCRSGTMCMERIQT